MKYETPSPDEGKERFTREHWEYPPERLVGIAAALARRQEREYDQDRAPGNAEPIPLPSLKRAFLTGRTIANLKRLEDPHSTLEKEEFLDWCMNADIHQEVINTVTKNPLFTKLSDETKKRFIEQGAGKFRETLSPLVADFIEDNGIFVQDLNKIDRLVAGAAEVAEQRGITEEEVLDDDDYYAEAFRNAYTPEAYLAEEQRAAASFDPESLIETAVKSATLLKKDKGDTRDYGEIKADIITAWSTFDEQGGLRWQRSLLESAQETSISLQHQLKARAVQRLIRVWGETALDNLPPELTSWMEEV